MTFIIGRLVEDRETRSSHPRDRRHRNRAPKDREETVPGIKDRNRSHRPVSEKRSGRSRGQGGPLVIDDDLGFVAPTRNLKAPALVRKSDKICLFRPRLITCPCFGRTSPAGGSNFWELTRCSMRFLCIDQAVRSGAWPNARIMAERLEVDAKTVRRDIT